MNDIIKREQSTSISIDYLNALASGVGNALQVMPMSGGGKPILRMLKTGIWVFGVGDDRVQEGSSWAINPQQMQHGWVCWDADPNRQKNGTLGERLVPVTKPMPEMPEPIRGNEWQAQRVFELKCLDGEDEGVEVMYKAQSDGGKQAAGNLYAAFSKQLEWLRINKESPAYIVPIIKLKSTYYTHQMYGQIFKPALDLVTWATMDLERQDAGAPAPAPVAPKPAPAAAAAKPAKPALGDAVGAAAPAQPPRRQRPVGRA